MKKFGAKYVFTLNPSQPQPLENVCITTEDDGTVLEVAEAAEGIEGVKGVPLLSERSDVLYFDDIIIPGMVNAHCHIELSHLKGVFKEATGMSGFIDQINALRSCVDFEGRQEAMAEEFKSFQRQGVVAVSDISNCNESFELKKKYLNASQSVYYRTCAELFGSEPEDADKVLEGGVRLAGEAVGMGLEAAVTPHACYTMSPKLLTITAGEGLKSGYISYHSEESVEEEDMVMYGRGALYDNYKRRGLSTPPVCGTSSLEYFIERLRDGVYGSGVRGSVPSGGRINLVHNVAITQRSITAALNALKEPYFTICPLSNVFIHRALPPLDLMRSNNLTICLGTDSLSSNKILSMAEEMKCIAENFPHIPLAEILKWACYNGAKMLNRSELGSIERGKRPGLVRLSGIDCANGFAITHTAKTTRII